jgi:outer membrane usher protein FimD/PapC
MLLFIYSSIDSKLRFSLLFINNDMFVFYFYYIWSIVSLSISNESFFQSFFLYILKRTLRFRTNRTDELLISLTRILLSLSISLSISHSNSILERILSLDPRTIIISFDPRTNTLSLSLSLSLSIPERILSQTLSLSQSLSLYYTTVLLYTDGVVVIYYCDDSVATSTYF